MSCSKHFLMFKWERHHWERRVSATVTHTQHQADMWGRVVGNEHVLCQAEYVCRDCGAVRQGEECGCDKARADQCAVRLAALAESPASTPAAGR